MAFRERMILDSDVRQELTCPDLGPIAHHGARTDTTLPSPFRMQARDELLDVATRQRPKELQHFRSQLCGAAILMVTAMLWASAGPTTKYLFLLPAPPSAALLTACISVATALFLLIGVLGSAFDASTSPPSSSSSPTASQGPSEAPGSSRPVRRRKPWIWKAYSIGAAGAGRGGGGSLPNDVTAEDEAEAEALLHSGVHVTGGGAGAASGAAAAAAALFAVQEEERLLEAAAGPGFGYVGRPLRVSMSDGCGDGVWHMRPPQILTTSALRSQTGWPGEEQELGRMGELNHPQQQQQQGLTPSQSDAPSAHSAISGRHSSSTAAWGPAGAPPPSPSPPAPAPTPAPPDHDHDATDPSEEYDNDLTHSYYDGADMGRQHPPDYHTIPVTDPALSTSGTIPSAPGTHCTMTHTNGGGPGDPRGGIGTRRGRRTWTSKRLCRWRLRLLTAPARSLFAAGAELGVYNVMAAALGAWGMQRISATRSAFLAQATALITPLLVAASGGRVSGGVWAACGCGALGGALMALDGARSSGVAVVSLANDSATAAAGAGLAGVGMGAGDGAVGAGVGRSEGVMDSSSRGRRLLDTWLTARDVMKMETRGNNVIPSHVLPGGGGGGGGGWWQEGIEPAELWGGGPMGGAEGENTSGASMSAELGSRGPGSGLESPSPFGLSVAAAGAVYVLLSCVFWGLGTVRLGVHSARFRPLHLAAAAAVSYAGLSLLWLLWESMAGLSDMLELGVLLRNHVAAALLLWAGLGPGALSSYLQVVGQQTVPPAQAQVLFSSTPLWSALIAQLLLPGEAMGPLAWLGGVVMLAASLMASLWQ